VQIEQCRWMAPSGWEPGQPGRLGESAGLVLLFGSTSLLKQPRVFETIRAAYPRAHLFGCSTAGEIYGSQVSDDSLVVTAVRFEQTQLKIACFNINDVESSFEAGTRLAQALDQPGLVHVLVLSEGLKVNGSELVKGLTASLPNGVTVTGGLSGDGERFQETFVLCDSAPERGTIAALGLYGERLRVGYGSLGGWDSFGPERLITRSKGNVLYELDGRSALDLYKTYLGEHASGLPATASGETGVVRTILAVDEAEQSVIFAGDVPQGAYARLMKANFDRLIDGAIGAAKTSYAAIGSSTPELAILISCVGRKLLLKQRIEEEVEGVRDIMGEGAILAGFYSYGEISPFTPGADCELHNQTMTITTLSEREVTADA
jgi:hypothetical protein